MTPAQHKVSAESCLDAAWKNRETVSTSTDAHQQEICLRMSEALTAAAHVHALLAATGLP